MHAKACKANIIWLDTDCEYGNETIMLLNEHGCHLKRNFEYTVITWKGFSRKPGTKSIIKPTLMLESKRIVFLYSDSLHCSIGLKYR